VTEVGSDPIEPEVDGGQVPGEDVARPDAVEIRVVACLVEKQRTTPDVYPLSLNSLRIACNQSTNRDPVVEFDEQAVLEALRRLALRGWTWPARPESSGSKPSSPSCGPRSLHCARRSASSAERPVRFQNFSLDFMKVAVYSPRNAR
jgi:hypothetical protein